MEVYPADAPSCQPMPIEKPEYLVVLGPGRGRQASEKIQDSGTGVHMPASQFADNERAAENDERPPSSKSSQR